MLNATQSTYAGGKTDGFVARFSSDLSQMLSSTYVGGSGDDRVLALTSDSLGNVFVAGSTSSLDFPVTANATQPTYGGGATDGFLVHFDIDGSPYHATYYGGSGDDRVFGLYAPGDYSVYLSGYTSSQDLPAARSFPAKSNSANGFIAHVANSLMGLAPIVGAKDVRVVSDGVIIGGYSGPLLSV
jgi:hypothetical protein